MASLYFALLMVISVLSVPSLALTLSRKPTALQSVTQRGWPRIITRLSASYSNNPDFLSRVSRIGKDKFEGASTKISRIFSAEAATNAKLAAALDMDEKEVKFVRDMGEMLARGLESQKMALDHAMNIENRYV
jgi:hypothetical protein